MLEEEPVASPWKTKPTDRLVLKWIKCHLSAHITPTLVRIKWLRPWMITISSAVLGSVGGIVFALGLGWLAGLIATASQVLDGVDGQFARLKGEQSVGGAFLDSVLDRYTDGAMVIGMIIYLVRLPVTVHRWQLLILGALALIGSNLISYTTARAGSLGIRLDVSTVINSLANKGTRTTVMILSCFGSLFWAPMPLVTLIYLALYTNLVVVVRIIQVSRLAPVRHDATDGKDT